MLLTRNHISWYLACHANSLTVSRSTMANYQRSADNSKALYRSLHRQMRNLSQKMKARTRVKSLLMRYPSCLILHPEDVVVGDAEGAAVEDEVDEAEDEVAEVAEGRRLESLHLLDHVLHDPQHPCSHSPRRMMVRPIRRRQMADAYMMRTTK